MKPDPAAQAPDPAAAAQPPSAVPLIELVDVTKTYRSGELDVIALQLEGTAERVPDGGLVVDDENLHRLIVRTDVRGA